MEKERLYQMIDEREGFASLAFPALMRKVYLWMTLALAITAVTAWGVANSPSLLMAIYGTKYAIWGIIIAELALVFTVSGAINRLSLTTATLLFTLYSVLTGVTLASIFIMYSPAIITKVFLLTAGTFGVMAVVGYTTKTDLTSLGKLMFMALLGLIIATVVNLFFIKSGSMDLIISYVGVLVFVGLTAYDSQKIKHMLMACPDASEQAQKLALLGALSLYLDFINLFLYLLRIFGKNND